VIPARGGSKSIKNKNTIPLRGRPLIYYVIQAALDSHIFDKIVISTDCPRIKVVAEVYGIETIGRPLELAEDDSRIEDVIVDVLRKLPKHDYVQLLEPTCPLLQGADIIQAANKLLDARADMIISVCKSNAPIGVSAPLGDNGSMKGFVPSEIRRRNRQDIPEHYQLNSAIYMGKWDVFYNDLDYYEINTIAYIMRRDAVIHIDEGEDLIEAERILKRQEWAKAALG